MIKLIKEKFSLVLLSQAVISGGGFLTTVLLARQLTVDEFGYFVTFWMISIFVVNLLSAYLIQPFMTQYFAIASDQKEKYLRGVLYFFSSPLLSLCVITTIILIIFKGEVVVGFLLYTILAQELLRKVIIALGYPLEAFFSDLLLYTLRVFALAVGDLPSLNYIFVLFTATSFLSLFPIIIVLIKTNAGRARVKDFIFAINLNHKQGKWLLLSNMMQWSSVNVFVLLAAVLISPAGAAYVRAAQSIVAIFNVLLIAIETQLPIVLVQLSNNLSRFEFIVKVFKMSLIILLPIILILVFFSEEVMVLTYGDKYAIASECLAIYAVVYLLMLPVALFKSFLRSIDRVKYIFNAYVISSAVALVSVYPFEHFMGIVGAVIGILLVNVLLFVLLMQSVFKNKNEI